MCSLSFLRSHLRLSVTEIRDWYHRYANDVSLGISRAGQFSHYIQSLAFMNIQHGPWCSQAFYTEMIEQSVLAAKVLSPDDSLLMELWPQILADDPRIDGPSGPERLENSRSGRAAYLKHLPCMPVFCNRGTKASTTRWFSWTSSWSSLDAYFHTKLLVLTLLCMSRGWAKSIDDLKSDLVVPESKKRKEPDSDPGKAAASLGVHRRAQ
eukprot:5828807-Amphidinium_carterae.1